MTATTNKIVVAVEPREVHGKNACRRIRTAGRVPGNVYGMNLPAFSIAVEGRRVEEVLRLESGRNTIFTLAVPGAKESRDVMIGELQRDPVTEDMLHVDFVRVDPTKPVQVQVPIRLEGTPQGVRADDGVLDFVQREVLVSCLPGQIPGHLTINVAHLHIGQHVSVKDLKVGDEVQMLTDPQTIIAVVAAPRAEVVEVAEVAEGEVAAEGEEEPEVAKKGKEEESEAAGSDEK